MPCTVSAEGLIAMVRTVTPATERALTGWPEILAYLHDTLGLRRLSGKPLTVTQLRRWKRDQGFPVLAGGVLIPTPRGMRRQLPLTTTIVVSAWVGTRDPRTRLFAWQYFKHKPEQRPADSSRASAPVVAGVTSPAAAPLASRAGTT